MESETKAVTICDCGALYLGNTWVYCCTNVQTQLQTQGVPINVGTCDSCTERIRLDKVTQPIGDNSIPAILRKRRGTSKSDKTFKREVSA